MVDNDAVLEQIYEDLLEAGFEDCEETAELARLAFFMDSMEVCCQNHFLHRKVLVMSFF